MSLFGLNDQTPLNIPSDATTVLYTPPTDTLTPRANMVPTLGVLENDTGDTDEISLDTLTHGTLIAVPEAEEDDSKKANFRFRNWKWTMNFKWRDEKQYTKEDAKRVAQQAADLIKSRLEPQKRTLKWAFQIEEGKDGVIHIQGFIGGPNAMWRNSVLSTLTCFSVKPWLKTCNGNPTAYIRYCMKEDTRVAGPWKNGVDMPVQPAHITDVKDPLELVAPYAWQSSILSKLAEEPDDRTVIWVRDAQGGAGKTALCKHLVLKHNALMVGGRVQDATYALAQYKEQKKPMPKIVIFNFTRSQEQSVSYQAIEAIKDGLFFSGKYESGMVCMDPPHLVCFANFAPEMNRLSIDRWKLFNIIKPGSTDNLELVIDDQGHVVGPNVASYADEESEFY